MKKMIMKMMYMGLITTMIYSFLWVTKVTVSAKTVYKVNTVYNTSKSIKGKAKKNSKVIVQIGNKKYSKKANKKGNFKIAVSKNKLKNKIGKKITVKFYQKKKNKKGWKKVKTKKTYIIANTVKLNQITDSTQMIQGYTRPGYKVKLDIGGVIYEKKASAKKGSFKIDTGKAIKQCDYTLKIYKTNGSLFKSYEHKAGSTKTEAVFEYSKKPELKKVAIKKTYKYKEYDGSTYKETKLDAYNLTWTAVSGADGYDLFVYYPAENIWEKIKTVTTSSYKMTNLYVTKYKFKVKAYKMVASKKNYGAESNTITIEPDSILWEGNAEDDSKYKEQSFTQKVFDENTFVYQNEIRQKVGVSALNWSNVCYEIAKVRAKETYNYFRKYGNKGIHDECDDTIKRILEKTYHVDYTKYGTIKYYNGKYDVEENNFTENWAEDTGRSGIDDLVNSPLHYATMISKDYKVGAVSAYNSTNSMLFESTSAIYCKTDNLDIQIANDK